MKKLFSAVAIITCAVTAVVTVPQYAAAAPPSTGPNSCDTKGMILGFKPWYHGLTKEEYVDGNDPQKGTECHIDGDIPLKKMVTVTTLNIVQDIFVLAGYISVAFTMYGGFLFLTSAGSPDQAASGRRTIIHSLIGLAIAVSAGAIVNFIAGAL
ncbi:MAG: pilin [Candidatus Saccharibacteria bacterium]|nr:pilin [Candidatus Saccharibacteria bacterium]